MTGRVDDIADWLREMGETSRRLDGSAVIAMDVETLAGRISDLMDDWDDGWWPRRDVPWQRLRTVITLEDRERGARASQPPWKPGDTIYGLEVGNGLWEYRPVPFALDGDEATAYVVPGPTETP